MILRFCKACGATFTDHEEDATVPYCLDCAEAPVPMLAEVYGQIPAPALVLRGIVPDMR